MSSAQPTITAQPRTCYHCGEPVPAGLTLVVELLGEPRAMCCAGCQAVAEAIANAGLGDYYRFRTEAASTPEELVPELLRRAAVYDDPRVAGSFAREHGADLLDSRLVLEGVECAACLWLIEQRLAALPGVESVDVNYATHRARVLWHPSATRLSRILEAVQRIGYAAHPYDPQREETVLDAEHRRQLRRLGLAGLLGMQVMMIAIVLYSGDWYGMASRYRSLFTWVSLLLTAPVVVLCARPFFAGALRDLRNRSPGMDVPVALGIGIAFGGSVVATVAGAGEVYYDSVVMFVFVLLLARFLELQARRRAVAASQTLAHATPALATRLRPAGIGVEREDVVPVGELAAGDRVLVRPGETVPADGRVLAGRSAVDESVLTGESRPRARGPGDELIGGTVNHDSPLEMEVVRVGADSVLAQVLELADRARARRPRIAALADRVAGWFVTGVLVAAVGVALWWWRTDPTGWLPVTISVLVVTCPCALSLATPTAVTAGLSALLRRGVVVADGQALERLARVDRFVFDKTGTLTLGSPRIDEVRSLDGTEPARLAALAASLERGSEHPLGVAIRRAVPAEALLRVTDVHNVPGAGVCGEIAGRRLRLGSLEHALAEGAAGPDATLLGELEDDPRTVVWLAGEERLLGVVLLDDALRPGAAEMLARLAERGAGISLLSGDRPAAVARVATALHIEDAAGAMSPAAKVERVRSLQALGHVVAMTGDGINDAPVLAAADVSFALGSGTQAARASADLILTGEDLGAVADAVRTARATRAVIGQNLAWAAGYNVLALPAAALGLVPPWLAAIGMSASSLLVVANSTRAGRGRR